MCIYHIRKKTHEKIDEKEKKSEEIIWEKTYKYDLNGFLNQKM